MDVLLVITLRCLRQAPLAPLVPFDSAGPTLNEIRFRQSARFGLRLKGGPRAGGRRPLLV